MYSIVERTHLSFIFLYFSLLHCEPLCTRMNSHSKESCIIHVYRSVTVTITDELASPSVDHDGSQIPASAVISGAQAVISDSPSPTTPSPLMRRQLSHDQGKHVCTDFRFFWAIIDIWEHHVNGSVSILLSLLLMLYICLHARRVSQKCHSGIGNQNRALKIIWWRPGQLPGGRPWVSDD